MIMNVAALQISMLCASRHSLTTQYLQINELWEQFLSEADANEIHTHERELDYVLNKYIPYLRVAYMPYYAKKLCRHVALTNVTETFR